MPNAEPAKQVDGDLSVEYRRRLEDRRAARERWRWREDRVADLRLLLFIVLVAAVFFVYRSGWQHAWWLLVPFLTFIGLVLINEPFRRRHHRAVRAVEYYERGIDRMNDQWSGKGTPGLDYLDPAHPYAADLDLFGTGSLFERLCTARTRSGEESLASWLLAPASLETIRERHEAIDELRPRLDLREDLELLGSNVRSAINPAELTAWGETPRVFTSGIVRLVAAILAACGALTLIGWAFLGTGLLPFLIALAVEGAFAWLVGKRVRQVLLAVNRRGHDLVLLGELLDRLEREPFQSPLLLRLQKSLETEGHPASTLIRRLARMIHLLDTRANQFFAPFAAVLLWGTQFAMAIDAWRHADGPSIRTWLKAAGEFEALCALASYAAENPSDPFPELDASRTHFEAVQIGHPLIPRSACVRNDVSLGGDLRALVISGSNMSGKSTLLRSVGVAAVMAQAGLPVRANRLSLSPLAVGATLRVQDSLQAGKSRFYAEITRVRQVVDLSQGKLPLLFLFDEIFHGTNSHDRRIGAESILRGLLNRGAIGLITTHDLALAEIVTGTGQQAVNVHFEDRFENGRMTFDYTMRPGVVEHSNALELMRAVGLEV